MNTDELEWALIKAGRRVLEIQAKLRRWARDDPHRRFDDLFNFVADPGFLLVAWNRVRGDKGARTAGVDGRTAPSIEMRVGAGEFLDGLRSQVKDGSFRPVPVRERMIPKAGGKLRRLGIATITDRVVQASLKLVLEPIFEADFLPCSYGFRPKRRAHDAVAEVRLLTSEKYEWIVEGDIKACFDEISHSALMERVRARVGDKRVLALVKAFLKAGILSEDGQLRDNDTGTPQGSILSPLLSNVALSVQRHRKPGANRHCVYTYPAKKSLQAIMDKVKTLCREVGTNQPLDALLLRLNPAVRGWRAYFRPGVSSATFSYLRYYLWHTVWGWVRRKHPKTSWKKIRSHYGGRGSWRASENRKLFDPSTVGTTRYRYRGAAIPTPWTAMG